MNDYPTDSELEKIEKWPMFFNVGCGGEFYKFRYDNSTGEPALIRDSNHIGWDCRADSLDEQSQETIEFLAKVLGVDALAEEV